MGVDLCTAEPVGCRGENASGHYQEAFEWRIIGCAAEPERTDDPTGCR